MRRIQIAIALVLCGCTTLDQPRPTDKIRDAEAAIAAGKEICQQHGGDTGGQWTAKFHSGMWEVEQIDPHDTSKWYERVRIWPDNGKSNRCEIMVVET